MNIKEKIKKSVEKSITNLSPLFQSFEKAGIEVLIEKPRETGCGDYSTNVALILAKKLQKSPTEIANEIVSKIKIGGRPMSPQLELKKVEVAGLGFINFYLSRDSFIENIRQILRNKNFGANKNLKNKKIIIEYTDPNILKEFHIGHLMSNTIGESISGIIEFQGAKVKRLCYQGDVGLHVAKAIFGKIKNPEFSWQQCYVFGSEQYEKDENAKKEIVELNKKVFERFDRAINRIYDDGKKWSLANFDEIYKKLGTKFDYLFFESETAGFGKKIVEEGLKKGVFEKGEKGAIVYRGEKQGLHTRVFINSEGLPTYEAKELGLAKIKYDKFKYDNSIIVTANEQNEYFKVVLKAMFVIFPELEKRTRHIGHGMMRLPEGKMSSRTGKVISAESLIEKIKEMVLEKMKERDLSKVAKDEIAEKVAIGALKYSILKQSIGSDIIYDFEKSISFEGDSGPYLQYSCARAQSVLRKAKSEKIKPSLKNVPGEVGQLEKLMHYFPEVVEKAGKPARKASPARQHSSLGGGHSDAGGEYAPHLITTYLTELAREFNNYYAKEKIIDKNDKFSPYKIALAEAFSIIMKNGLWLLGIQVPERM